MKKILSLAFAALFVASAFAQKSETLLERNQLTKTPPMGWMTWNLFKGDISEQLIQETADAMVEQGFRDAGMSTSLLMTYGRVDVTDITTLFLIQRSFLMASRHLLIMFTPRA